MKNLITLQNIAVEAILAAPQNGPRAASYQLSLLNRRPKVVGRAMRQFKLACCGLGFSPEQAERAWQDVRAMALLEDGAEATA